MIEIESVAPSTTSGLPENDSMANLPECHTSECVKDRDKSIDKWDAIVKDLDDAQEVINELADIETTVAGIPVKLKLDMDMGTHPTYHVKVIALINGKEIPINHAAKNPKAMLGKEVDDAVAQEVYEYVRSPEFKKQLETFNKAAKRYNDAVGARETYLQSQFKGFEGITIPRRYKFDRCVANVVEFVEKFDDNGKLSVEEKHIPIGNPCAVTAKFRVDCASKVMQRVRFITDNYDLKEVDVEMGQLNDTRSIIEFGKKYGCRITRLDLFKQMLDDQFYANVHDLTILEATNNIGWYGNSFVCGAECYGGDIICVSPGACEKWYKEGTLDGYMQGIKGLVNIPEVRLAMGIAVAAMILQFIGVSSFTVTIDGKTSQMKTIRFKVALSMLGNPNKIMIDFNSSNQAPNHILRGINGVMILIDEVKNDVDTKRARDLIKNVSTGMNRKSLGFHKGALDEGEFSTIVAITSEKELFDASTYGGTRARCIALKADGTIPFLKDEVKAFERHVAAKNVTDPSQKNFGHLGHMIYEVIMKHPDLRADFDAIKEQFAPTTAIENRIGDMQAAIALGMELLEEVFDSIRGAYPWVERMDSVQVVKDQTADYVNESTVPEWVEQLGLLISNADCFRRHFEEDPEVDDEGNDVKSKGGVFQVKGYLHNSIEDGKMLLLNIDSTNKFLEHSNINQRSLFRQIKGESDILKTYGKGNTIPNPQDNAIEGSRVYAILLDKLIENQWFKSGDNAKVTNIDRDAEIEAINSKENETGVMLSNFCMFGESRRIANKSADYCRKYYTEHIPQFIQWYESQGHTHEEAVQKNDEITSSISLKKQQLEFFNNFRKEKVDSWTLYMELFWKKKNKYIE